MLSMLLVFWTSGPNKQAYKALVEGDFEKVESLLIKSIEKDSINPGAYYIFSLMYATDSFPGYNLDSSYLLINRALNQLKKVDEKQARRIEKLELSEAVFSIQKESIQNRAFLAISEEESVDSWNYYLNYYRDSPLIPRATIIRDSLAYSHAQRIHKWESYKYFLSTYPDAEQYEEALENYEWLLFREKTAGKKLNDLKKFYKDFPGSPYRDRVINDIYKQETSDNEISSHKRFISQYPQTSLAKRSKSIIYHLTAQNDRSKLLLSDSLRFANSLEEGIWIPFFQDEKYGFLDTEGDIRLLPQFEAISGNYFCEGLNSDYIELIDTAKFSSGGSLYGRNGKLFFEGFHQCLDLGYGYIAFEVSGQWGVTHKSGFEVLDAQYDEVQLIGSNFIAFLKDDLFGIATLNGDVIFEPYFEEIEFYEGFILLYKEDKLSIATVQQIAQLVTQDEKPFLDFLYEDVELFDEDYLLCYAANEEALLDRDLNVIIPLGKQNIFSFDGDWYLKNDQGYTGFNEQKEQKIDEIFEEIQSNKHWVASKKNSKWTLFSRSVGFQPRTKLDSVKLISESIVYYKDDLFQRLLFGRSREVRVESNERVRPVQIEGSSSVSDFMSIISNDGYSVYDPTGNLIFKWDARNVTLVNDSTFIVTEKKGKGLMGRDGKWILRPRYQSIDKSPEGLLNLLVDGKIGAYDLVHSVYLSPQYDISVKRFSNKKYVVFEDGFYSLIDENAEPIIEGSFQQLFSFDSTTAILKQDDLWKIVNVQEGKEKQGNIYSVEVLNGVGSEKLTKYRGDKGYGLYSTIYGELLKPEYNEIFIVRNGEEPIYFAERFLSDAELYVIIYVNYKGEKIWSQAFREEEYALLFCD